jgi:hypothetical protein
MVPDLQSAEGGVTHEPVHDELQLSDVLELEQYDGQQTLSTSVQEPHELPAAEG